MARPCGCAGECGCTYIGVDGIRVTGTGTSRDPGRIGLSTPITGAGCTAIMSCVGAMLGSGLSYDGVTGILSAKLSADADNGLIFGTDGGLYADTGGGGGGGGGPTIDGLVAQTVKIVGSTYGNGNAMYPEGNLSTYEAAMAAQRQLIHVPVHRSADYALWALDNRDIAYYNYTSTGATYDFDLGMGERQVFLPGGFPDNANFFSDYASQAGYFGFRWPMTKGIPRLSDVCHIASGRALMLWENKDTGASNNQAKSSDTSSLMAFYASQYGVQKAIIVTSEIPTASTSPDRADILAGLQIARTAGIAIGLMIGSLTQLDAQTAASLVTAGHTWVFIDYSLADTQAVKVKAYKDAGLNVMLTGGHRQYQYNLLNNTVAFGAGGLKGIMCFDPTYCGGELHSYAYRRYTSSWAPGTPDYGRHSAWSDKGPDGLRDRWRGYTPQGSDQLNLDGNVLLPEQSDGVRDGAYLILMGEQCPTPINTATTLSDNYDIDISFSWETLTADRTRWMSIFVCNPEDRDLRDYPAATAYTRGYHLYLDQNGLFNMGRYDGTGPGAQYALSWSSGFSVSSGNDYRVKVRVRPDRIVMGPSSEPEAGSHTRTFNAAVGGGQLWRGRYFWLGRQFNNTGDSTRNRWRNLVVTPL
jgi:hypothetical protein